MNDEANGTLKLAKSRVSNEQLLAAIMAQTAAITNLVGVLSGPAKPVLAEPKAPSMRHSAAVVAPSGDGTVGSLQLLKTYPAKFNSEAATYVINKATAWRQAKGLPEGSVTVVIQRSAYGKLSSRFFQNTTKAPTNCVGAIARV